MGYGSWTSSSWTNYTTSKGYTASSSASEMYTSRRMKDAFDPTQFKLRESCDSAEHPNSTPIVLALDVTGSMSSVLETVSKRLGDTMSEIYKRNPVSDPQVCFMALGDGECDSSPIQVTQFESDIRIAEQLNDIYFERGGGGNSGESYAFPWYVASRRCKTDAWDKHHKKGFLFTVGDECCLPQLTRKQIKKFLGDDVERDLSATELLTEVSRKYEVYHLIVNPVGYQPVYEDWKHLLGKNAIIVEDVDKIPEIIISILELHSGKSAVEVINSWDGSVKLVVRDALKGLSTSGGYHFSTGDYTHADSSGIIEF